MAAMTPAAEATQRGLRQSLVAGSIGVLVHWFDWAIYAYLATTMADVFFPTESGTAGLLSTFAVFAVAFLVRPLGSLIFGHLGDKFGRKKTLSLVITVMAGGTVFIGLIPSYQHIGIFAPILLIAARVVQGLAAGGEFGSAAAFTAEYSPRRSRGFSCSWVEVGSVLGFLLAAFVVWVLQSVLSPDEVRAWGWRVPFLLTAPLAAVGLYLRLKIEDTPDFKALEQLDQAPASPVREVFRFNGKQLTQTVGIETFMNCTFYVVLVYLISYQEEFVKLSADTAAMLSTMSSLTALLIIPLSGIVSDRVGRKPVLMTAAVLLIVLAYPLFVLMHSPTTVGPAMATFGLTVILSIILGTHTATVAELFPTRTRQSGLSIGYSIAGAFFAGTLPFLNTWLIGVTDNDMIPGITLVVVGIVGLVTLLTIPETRGIPLLQEQDRLAPEAS